MQIEVVVDGCSPTRANESDAGLDLIASHDGVIYAGQRMLVDCGIRIALVSGECAFIKPRSGLAVKHGIDVLAGVIDCNFRGDIKAVLINHDKTNAFRFTRGDRIAQLVVMHIDVTPPIFVSSLDENTDRGTGGFGSTGK